MLSTILSKTNNTASSNPLLYRILRAAVVSIVLYKIAKLWVFGLKYKSVLHVTYSSPAVDGGNGKTTNGSSKLTNDTSMKPLSSVSAVVASAIDNSNLNWKQKFIETSSDVINSYSPKSIFLGSSLFETVWPELSLSPAFTILGGGPYQVHPKYQPCKRQNIQLEEFKQDPQSPRVCSPMVVPPGLVSIDWYGLDNLDANNTQSSSPSSSQLKSKNVIVVLIPGLTGSSDALYIKITAETLTAQGYTCACYNPRGRGGNVVETPFLYSVGYTEDVRRVFDKLFEEYPNTSFVAVGFSLGGGVLTKYVGEEGKRCKLKGAMAVCSPIDCIPMSNHITHSLLGKLVIDPLLVSFVKEMAQMHEHILKDHHAVDLEAVKEARTMWEFDGSIIAPMMGFRSASEYYRKSSAGLVCYYHYYYYFH